MTLPKVELRCPFCRAVLAPHVAECHRCHAKRHTRRGLSPTRFRLFVATWLALAVPLVLGAAWAGFAPWLPGGLAPAYAMVLVGAKPSAEDVVRCRVEVIEPGGRSTVKVVEGECKEPGAAPAEPAQGQPPTLSQRRLASALHTTLSLLAGLLAAWGLMPLVRFAFLRKSGPTWVRRAAA